MPTVVLLSDQPVLLRGLTHVLESRGFEILSCCPAEQLSRSLPAGRKIDLTLLDVTGGLTLGVLTGIHSTVPDSPLVLWADNPAPELVFKSLEFGVRGIVQRTSHADAVAETLRRVARGEMQIGFGVAQEVQARRSQPALTPRETEVVGRLRRGLRNRQIATEMNITEGTVKIYLFRLFHKLGVRNRLELARCGATNLP